MSTVKELLHNKYLVVDVETTMNCPVGANAGSPHWHANSIVYKGFKTSSSESVWKDGKSICGTVGSEQNIEETNVLVGHNIKFDLLYLLNQPRSKTALINNLASGLRIWDTQLAEYVLSGQRTKFVTLDELATKYGGTVKASSVKTMFEAGYGADKVPESEIVPYLQEDLRNTELVFLAQVEQAYKQKQLPLIEAMMDSLVATTFMEHYGMKVDGKYLDEYKRMLEAHIKLAEDDWSIVLPVPAKEAGLTNWNSPQQLSTLLFGGKIKKKEKVPIGTFKNGNTKFATKEVVSEYKGLCAAQVYKTEKTKQGGWSVDDKVLEHIILIDSALRSTPTAVLAVRICQLVLRLRDLNKQLSTYAERLQNLTMPTGLVHPSFQHAATQTGRLSCANPNLQNQTDGDIRKAFVSRWEGGKLLNFDYGQLEIVALAYLSKDKQLIRDIEEGLDIHTELYKEMYSSSPDKDQRKVFKRLSFGLIYGAGVNTLAENAGVSVAVAKNFVNTFYTRYEGVKQWHDTLLEDVKRVRINLGDKSESGIPLGAAIQQMVTNRLLIYKEYENKYKKGTTSFSPTEVKNYPVQSFATGDIVPTMLGVLIREWLSWDETFRNGCIPVCTVHDSVVFDCKPEYVERAMELIPSILVKVEQALKNTFSIEFGVKVKVGRSAGANWKEQTDWSDVTSEV